MRLGTVIGRVTLTLQEPVYRGGALLLIQPLPRSQYAALSQKNLQQTDAAAAPRAAAAKPSAAARPGALVAYDQLGAGPGHIVGFTEGAEAAAPFTIDAPVDAYVACIVDRIDYHPPATA
ncbi:MAG: EutN/CcmL family microcompartment protein [Opitutaceae bacterium]|jgi:ethanolamine utilization protein EutN|nr:EutN/CcmL family microcompartment protein [Opitutaceae bacterium]